MILAILAEHCIENRSTSQLVFTVKMDKQKSIPGFIIRRVTDAIQLSVTDIMCS